MSLLRYGIDFEGVQLLRDGQPCEVEKNSSHGQDRAVDAWNPDERCPRGPQKASKGLILAKKNFFSDPAADFS
jgi:hypothetical protein